MMNFEISDWLSNWANKQVDGDWEHELGISLTMLDNPGWNFKVDLVNYENHLQDIPYILVEKSDADWLGCKIQNSYLNICGILNKLSQIFLIFHTLICLLNTFQSDNKFTKEDLEKLIQSAYD